MLAIFNKELRDRRNSLIGYCFIGLLFMVMYISMFPAIKEQSANFTQIMKSMPAGLSTAFGINADSFSKLESFLSIEYFSLMWPLMLILLATSRAGAALAGEVERGTMRALLALPVSRTNIYLAKYFAGLSAITIFVAVTIAGIIPMAAAFGQTVPVLRVLEVVGLCLLFGAAVYSVGLMFSAFVGDRGKAYMIVGGLLMLSYVANIVAGLQSSLSWLHKVSIFHYFDGVAALGSGTFNLAAFWLFSGMIGISLVIGLSWFNRRDIPQ